MNGALISRSQVFALQPLENSDLITLLQRAITDRARGFGVLDIQVAPDALDELARLSEGMLGGH